MNATTSSAPKGAPDAAFTGGYHGMATVIIVAL